MYPEGVSSRKRVLLFGGVAVGLLAIIIFFVYRSNQRDWTNDALLARLPREGASVMHVDFGALRKAGALQVIAGAATEHEPEYKAFLEKTGFDYKKDLDLALVSFHKDGVFLVVRGRFDWQMLQRYANDQGGSCYQSLCRVQGSTPEKKISYFPLRQNIMGMAVGNDDFLATRLQQVKTDGPSIPSTDDPIWAYLSPQTLAKSEEFPIGTQLFAQAFEVADSVVLSLGAAENAEAQKQGDFVIKLAATCRSATDAKTLMETLQKITRVLNALLKQVEKPSDADLGAVLMAGEFKTEDRRVLGRWPIKQAFLESLANDLSGDQTSKESPASENGSAPKGKSRTR